MQIFGEMGVLADNGEKVQCHLCGKWFKNLGGHIVRGHKMPCHEYLDQFGFKRSTALASSELSARMRNINSDLLRENASDTELIESNKQRFKGDGNPAKRADIRERMSFQAQNCSAKTRGKRKVLAENYWKGIPVDERKTRMSDLTKKLRETMTPEEYAEYMGSKAKILWSVKLSNSGDKDEFCKKRAKVRWPKGNAKPTSGN